MRQKFLPRLVTTVAIAVPGTALAQQRQNIILFMVDDMGWQDTSVPFWNQRTPLNNTYETPNMERLASEDALLSGIRCPYQFAQSLFTDDRCQRCPSPCD